MESAALELLLDRHVLATPGLLRSTTLAAEQAVRIVALHPLLARNMPALLRAFCGFAQGRFEDDACGDGRWMSVSNWLTLLRAAGVIGDGSCENKMHDHGAGDGSAGGGVGGGGDDDGGGEGGSAGTPAAVSQPQLQPQRARPPPGGPRRSNASSPRRCNAVPTISTFAIRPLVDRGTATLMFASAIAHGPLTPPCTKYHRMNLCEFVVALVYCAAYLHDPTSWTRHVAHGGPTLRTCQPPLPCQLEEVLVALLRKFPAPD